MFYNTDHFNTPDIVDINDMDSAKAMLDKMSRITVERRIQPLYSLDNVWYQHRYLYDAYNLQIGDVYIMIPPEFIMVTSEATSQDMIMLRQENTQKIKAGHHKRTILVDLVFHGLNQLNGYPVDGPEGTYYVDGLRQLLAEFKVTPFLPISNELINGTYGIFNVALQAITISTVQGFPDVMKAQITLQEVTIEPYTQMPDVYFEHMIDWDLFRFYYQRRLTEKHEYKKLQSLPVNKTHYEHFKMKILDPDVFQKNGLKFLDILTDKEIVIENADTNYQTWLDSDVDDIHITGFQCGYSNLLTNIQLNNAACPTVQFMGGMDTIYNITFETKDYKTVQSLEQCQITNDVLVRDNTKLRSVGFVRLECELVEFTGSLFVMIESVTTNTVPGFPGLYNVQVNCVAYDIGQSEREELHGFMPFPEGTDVTSQTITQDETGIKTKAQQDAYAEWKLRQEIEVYPDLYLPTYQEVNNFIKKCQNFRSNNNLTPLPYDKYPSNPGNMLHGSYNPYTDPCTLNISQDVISISEIDYEDSYDYIVDPDFYIFYPTIEDDLEYNLPQRQSVSGNRTMTFDPLYSEPEIIEETDNSNTDIQLNQHLNEEVTELQKTTSATTTTTIVQPNNDNNSDSGNNSNSSGNTNNSNDSDSSNSNTSNGNTVNQQQDLSKFKNNISSNANRMTGHTYSTGCYGDSKDSKGEMFDNLGFITWSLIQATVVPASITPLKPGGITNNNEYACHFQEIDISKRSKGDLVFNKDLSQGGILVSGAKMMIASSEDGKVIQVFCNSSSDFGKRFNDGKTPNGWSTPRCFTLVNVSSSTQTSSTVLPQRTGATPSSSNLTVGTTEDQIWNFLKSKGLTDEAVAGIMGNWKPVSGNSPVVEGYYLGQCPGTNKAMENLDTLAEWTETLCNIKGSNFDKSGYACSNGKYYCSVGIAQWTGEEAYKLYNYASSKGKDWRDLNTQLEYFWDDLNSKGLKTKLNNCSSPEDAASFFRSNYQHAGTVSSVQKEAKEFYNARKDSYTSDSNISNNNPVIPGNTSGNNNTNGNTNNNNNNGGNNSKNNNNSNGNTSSSNNDSNNSSETVTTVTSQVDVEYTDQDTKYDLEYEETNLISMSPSQLEAICKFICAQTKGEFAQMIYDMMTHDTGKYGSIGEILSSHFTYPTETTVLTSTIEATVKSVFCDGVRKFPNYKIYYFASSRQASNFQERDAALKRINTIGNYTFWGLPGASSKKKYVITGSNTATLNIKPKSEQPLNETSKTVPVTYQRTVTSVSKFGVPLLAKSLQFRKGNQGDYKTLNNGTNVFNTSACDMYQYSARGRLLRAFPAYLFCILDDQSQWYDGRKLWVNYYTHKSVVDIAIHEADDMPTATATITVMNSYHNLDRTSSGVSNYSVKNDPELVTSGWFSQFMYNAFGFTTGSFWGPKITSKLLEMHQIIYEHARLREGARVHLRMGYGADPLALAPMINGHVSDVSLGDQITIVVTSDGHELMSHVTSSSASNQKDTNNGFLGLFGLGDNQESSNIIGEIMTRRESWFSHLMKNAFEGSKYGIEHFGTYIAWTIGEAIAAGAGIGASAGAVAGGGIGAAIGTVAGGVVGALAGSVSGGWPEDQWDIMKNVYVANYAGVPFCINSTFLGIGDDEANVVFNRFNMTPWDVFQICTQQVPEYIIKVTNHQFDSRLYFGTGNFMERYRYNIINSSLWDECKAACQVHYLDSISNIIDDQVKVTSKYSPTNVKVLYTRGSTVVPTKVLHSDDTIDFAYQKTVILDSPIVQDALGPDWLYEKLGYDPGKASAKRIGISTLLYGWKQQYQGQLILMGEPGIKAHDFLMLNDTFVNLFGVCTAREVVHSFNTTTGFTTSVVPGLIGFSQMKTSGMVTTVSNYLNLLIAFSMITEDRRKRIQNVQKYLNIFCNFKILMEKAKYEARFGSTSLGFLNSYATTETLRKGFKVGETIFNVIQYIEKFNNLKAALITGKLIKDIVGAFEGVRGAIGIIQGTFGALRAIGGAAAGTGIGIPVWIAIEVLLRLAKSLLEWIENRNVVVLLPLWWEGYPFVSGVKDGEKILLCSSNANATDENVESELELGSAADPTDIEGE